MSELSYKGIKGWLFDQICAVLLIMVIGFMVTYSLPKIYFLAIAVIVAIASIAACYLMNAINDTDESQIVKGLAYAAKKLRIIN